MSALLSSGDSVTEAAPVRAWLSLGSNIDPKRQIPAALQTLRSSFGELVVSPIYESEAVGFSGDNFYNLVVGIWTRLSARALAGRLREIEAAHGRVRGAEKFSSRTLDIDLLTFGEQVIDEPGVQVPRDEILRYAFVLRPLADVAPEERHPVAGRSYAALWSAFDRGSQKLWRVDGHQDPPVKR
jgi:2-amino-4-hydroxy-6-hydroxymethyldihydropteridine diphosphokinase